MTDGGLSRLLTRKEAAEYLRVSKGTLDQRNSVIARTIPHLRLGRRVIYRECDLAQWIESLVAKSK
jgi:excisionase family DNA binding protein